MYRLYLLGYTKNKQQKPTNQNKPKSNFHYYFNTNYNQINVLFYYFVNDTKAKN